MGINIQVARNPTSNRFTDSMARLEVSSKGNRDVIQLMTGMVTGASMVLSSSKPRLSAKLALDCCDQAVEEVAAGMMDTMAKPANMEIHSVLEDAEYPAQRATRSILIQQTAKKPFPRMPATESIGLLLRAVRCSLSTDKPALNSRIASMSKLVVKELPMNGMKFQEMDFIHHPGAGRIEASTYAPNNRNINPRCSQRIGSKALVMIVH